MFDFFHTLESVDSTNEYLKSFLCRKRPGAVAALEQTGGKGRHGRSWYSPRGEGAYVSMLLFPDWPLRQAEWLNRLAALTVVRSLRGLPGADRLQPKIKPPNDIVVGQGKLSGVLVETASLEDRLEWAIVGIGVNLSQRRFALPQAKLEPTSLLLEGIPPPSPSRFCAILVQAFSRIYRELEAGRGSRLQQEYESAMVGSSLRS